MADKVKMISNGVFLFLTGVRIELYNRLLMRIFLKRRFLRLACRIDKRLEKLRKEFSLLEERYVMFKRQISLTVDKKKTII